MNEIKSIVQEIETVMQSVDYEAFNKVVKMIHKDNTIFVSGEGRSGLVGKCFAIRMMHLGYNVHILGETLVPAMKKGDLLIALSGSGNSDYVVVDIKKAKKNKNQVIAFTSKRDGFAAEHSDVNVIIPATIRSDKGDKRNSIQLLGSLFDQSLHIVLDALTIKISQRDHITNETATLKHW